MTAFPKCRVCLYCLLYKNGIRNQEQVPTRFGIRAGWGTRRRALTPEELDPNRIYVDFWPQLDAQWNTEVGATCVICPDCAFTFDSVHTVKDGGYTCPACAEDRLVAELRAERERSQKLADALADLCAASDVTFETLANDYAPGEASRRALRKASETARAALDSVSVPEGPT